MTRIYLPILIMQLLVACKTSHNFDLTNTTPVSANEAPYVQLLVKKRIINLASDQEATEGSTVRVNEVPPTKSLDVDFDKNSLLKIVKAVCDSRAKDVQITTQSSSLVEGQWSGTGDSEKYAVKVEIVDSNFAVSCSKL